MVVPAAFDQIIMSVLLLLVSHEPARWRNALNPSLRRVHHAETRALTTSATDVPAARNTTQWSSPPTPTAYTHPTTHTPSDHAPQPTPRSPPSRLPASTAA